MDIERIREWKKDRRTLPLHSIRNPFTLAANGQYFCMVILQPRLAFDFVVLQAKFPPRRVALSSFAGDAHAGCSDTAMHNVCYPERICSSFASFYTHTYKHTHKYTRFTYYLEYMRWNNEHGKRLWFAGDHLSRFCFSFCFLLATVHLNCCCCHGQC